MSLYPAHELFQRPCASHESLQPCRHLHGVETQMPDGIDGNLLLRRHDPTKNQRVAQPVTIRDNRFFQCLTGCPCSVVTRGLCRGWSYYRAYTAAFYPAATGWGARPSYPVPRVHDQLWHSSRPRFMAVPDASLASWQTRQRPRDSGQRCPARWPHVVADGARDRIKVHGPRVMALERGPHRCQWQSRGWVRVVQAVHACGGPS